MNLFRRSPVGFQRRGFLEIGQSEKRIACSDQRGRLKCEKLADDGHQNNFIKFMTKKI
jgi:hypothetical protein